MPIPDVNDMKAIYPPREVFDDGGTYIEADSTNPVSQKQSPLVIGVEFPEEGGMLLYLENQKHPKKGWPFKQAIMSIDAVKKFIMFFLKFVMALPKNIVTGKVGRSFMEGFGNYADFIFKQNGVYLKSKYYCTMVREIDRVGMLMAQDDVERRFVRAVCMIFEFDDAYRYRLQDMLDEMDKDAFIKNPSKETRRLFDIMISRSQEDAEMLRQGKLPLMRNFLFWILYIPVIRRTAREFLKQVELEKLYLDTMDAYQCLTWNGYNFGGKTLYQRLIMRESVDEQWVKDGRKYIDTKGNEIKIPE